MPARLAAIVPLLAAAGLVALPYDLVAPGDGGLDFTWRPSQMRDETLADPIIRKTTRRAGWLADTRWIVRSRVEAAGDDAARTLWCDERNAAGLGGAGGDLATGGVWEPAAAGTCCLTTQFSPGELADQPLLTATLLAGVLRAHRSGDAGELVAGAARDGGRACVQMRLPRTSMGN